MARVSFATDITDDEIDAYVASGEPLAVAGAFTIDARGQAFIERIEGDPSTVVGVSIPAVRQLAGQLGVEWPRFWASPPAP
jgi:septum formation protein